MTLYQFNALDETEKWDVLWEFGVRISERFDIDHNILLYQIDGFYIEAFYHGENNVRITLRTFSSTNQLAPYLAEFDMDF